MSFIRQSKYRHVFGTPAKPEQCYSELRTDIGAADSDYVKVNSKFFVVPWRGGGGSVAVLRHDQVGKAASDIPTISGHTGAVVDFDFNPFNDHLLATGSVDCTAKLWAIPEGGLTQTITEPLVDFTGHSKKLSTVLFHPTANNVLLTSALDQHIKFWDVETGKEAIDIDEKHHQNAVQSICFNRNGSLFATTAKDKKLRIIDPRLDGNKVVQEGEGHQGTKGSRVQWLGNIDKLVTAGFSKLSERQYMIWDPRDISKPLASQEIDVSAGQIMIFYDEDSSLLYFAGKGDGNIRYYEVVDKEPYLYLIDEYKTNVPQRGMGMLPKYAVDFMGCEMVRLLKLEGTVVTPISFSVPRRNEGFQADLFSETRAPQPALEASAWFAGENAEPKTMQFSASMTVGGGASGAAFTAKQEKKAAPKVTLPPKTNNPQELLKQNEELRKRVEDLEKQLHELKALHGEN